MKVLLMIQYYPPEQRLVWSHQLARALVQRGHEVTSLTALPHIDQPRIYEGYRGRLFHTEMMDGVTVARSWVYATVSKKFFPRALNYGSYCVSSLVAGLAAVPRHDVIYAVLPPLPLGVTAAAIAAFKGSRLIVNVQDVYPRFAVEHGMLKNPLAIRFFERMEQWIYRKADRIVVISQGMREDLVSRGVADGKVAVVENWADPDVITPGPKDNGFRRELDAEGRFVLIYSGQINYNANLEPLVHAAEALRHEPFVIVIVGDGQFKARLEQLVRAKSLANVRLFPFQPLERYPDVLRAADMNFVSLNVKAVAASVPSKVYKQMAAGRAILAAAPATNELYRLVNAARCGKCILPDDPGAIVEALRWARAHPDLVAAMGENARSHLLEHHSLQRSADQISQLIHQAARQPRRQIVRAASLRTCSTGAEADAVTGTRHGDGVPVRSARLADLARIVRVHRAAFPAHFLTQLGDSFLKRYYRLILEYPLGVVLAVTAPPRGIVGFASGFLNPPAFYGKMRAERWDLAVSVIGAVLRNPRLFRRLLHNRQRVSASADACLDRRAVAELSSLAIDPAFHGAGMGRRLVEGFLARVSQMGAEQVYLLTDADNNQRVHRFYTGLGFSCEPDPSSLAERPMNRYVRLL